MISIIIATYNEVDNIGEMINRIFKYLPSPIEVIVVDDDSTDGTWQEVQAIINRTPEKNVKLIHRTRERGLASALLRGIVESRGDIIGWWDADMLMCPSIARKMLDSLGEHDIVIGSRYVEGGGDYRHWNRRIPSLAINKVAQVILGHGIKDYDSGIILMKRDVLDACLPVPTGFGEYFIEFIYCCVRRGMSVFEVPYVYTDRDFGLSKAYTSLPRYIIMGMRYLIRIGVALVRGSR